MEDRDRIQIARTPCFGAPSRPAKCQLAAGRSIRRITQEVQTQQRMIVEHAKRGSYHRLSITLGIPCDSDARLKVVLVCLDSFLQPKQVVSGRSQSLRGLELGRNLDVVADAIVESQVVVGAPAVLPEHTDRNVVE